jgi:hypothetical protein
VLWDLQKRGLLTFQEKKVGSATTLRSLRVTSMGRRVMATVAMRAEADPTHPGCDHEPEGDEAVTLSVDTAVQAPTPREIRYPRPTVTAFDSSTGITSEVPVEPRYTPPNGYPLLNDLMRRDRGRSKLATAAKLLEEAGETDLALATLEKAGEWSPLEDEMVRFIKATNRTDLIG